jgi:hypothetical protein
MKTLAALTLAHPSSLAAVQSTNRVTVHGSILGPWPSAAKMGSPDGVSFLSCTAERRGVGSRYPPRIGLSRLPVSPSLSSTSHRLLSTMVVRPPISFFSNPSASFSAFTHPGAVPVVLSLLPLLLGSSSLLSRADGWKTHRRGVQSNYRGELLGTGSP